MELSRREDPVVAYVEIWQIFPRPEIFYKNN